MSVRRAFERQLQKKQKKERGKLRIQISEAPSGWGEKSAVAMVIGISIRSGESKEFTDTKKTYYGLGDGRELLRIEPSFHGMEPDLNEVRDQFDQYLRVSPQLSWRSLSLEQLGPGMLFTDEPWFKEEGVFGPIYWFFLGAQGS